MNDNNEIYLPYNSINIINFLNKYNYIYKNSDDLINDKYIIKLIKYEHKIKEREHDIQVAAEIGQALLDKNQSLQDKLYTYEHNNNNNNNNNQRRSSIDDEPDNILSRFLRDQLNQRGEEVCGDIDIDWATFKKLIKRERLQHDELKHENNELFTINNTLKRKIESLQRQVVLIGALKQQVSEDRQEIDELHRLLEASKNLNNNNNMSSPTRDLIEEETNEYETQIKQLEDDINNLNSKLITERNNNNKNIKEMKEKLQNTLIELKDEQLLCQKRENDISELNSIIHTLRDEMNILSRLNSDLHDEISNKNKHSNNITNKSLSSQAISLQEDAKAEYYKEMFEKTREELERVKLNVKLNAINDGHQWFNQIQKPQSSESSNNSVIKNIKQNSKNTQWANILLKKTPEKRSRNESKINKDSANIIKNNTQKLNGHTKNNDNNDIIRGNRKTKYVQEKKLDGNSSHVNNNVTPLKKKLDRLQKKYPIESPYELEKKYAKRVSTMEADKLRRWELLFLNMK